ncbi:MAG: hypothetical protein HYV09_07545 [Deltaproteobacteria bacterium]|nr:hypothetical protein [Deltaproteobacteria bacterium]
MLAGQECAPRLSAGAICSVGNECKLGLYCVDGVCCDKPCSGGCEACSAAKKGQGTDGVCGPIKADIDPKNACAVGSGYPGSCGADGMCDGAGGCRAFAKSGVQCAAPGCEGASLVSARTCDGGGSCQPATPTTSCGAYTCSGSACRTGCTSSADCAAGYYCGGTTCQPKKANGAACGIAGECTSGNCVDAVCCNDACTGTCSSCTAAKKGTGVDGTCGPILDGRNPDGECGATTCIAGSLSQPVCNGTGSCRASVTACAPWACAASGTACATTCASDSDCASTAYCDATNNCVVKKTNGAACGERNECASNNCVDGVCCNTACLGGCVACTAALKGSGANGVCDAIKADTDPKNACEVGLDYPSSCRSDGMCDGTGTCRTNAKAGTVCALAGCKDGSLNGARTCDAAGTCQPASTTGSCGTYACAGAGCATSCTTDASCNAASYCVGGACVAKKANGAACGAANECASGSCADGVCCDVSCSGKCQACTAAKKGSGTDGTCGAIGDGADPDDECTGDTCVSGTLTVQVCDGSGACKGKSSSCGSFGCNSTGDACLKACTVDGDCGADYYCTAGKECAKRKPAGSACAARNECTAGLFCADGVCCDQACNGQCQACNEKGSEGSCIAVVGAPRGGRTACKGDGSACNGACDGVNGGACVFPSTSTTCGDGCKDAKLAVCDGVGACLAPVACPGNLACDGPNKCKSSCAADADCVTGYRCVDGKCAPKPTATCSADGLSSVSSEPGSASRSCAPYKCGPSGDCLGSCANTSDCAPGSACDLSKSPGQCVPSAGGATDEGGGCATSAPSAPTSNALAAAGALVAALAIARRRRSGSHQG